MECIDKLAALLGDGKEVRHGDWNGKEIDILNQLNLLTAKPVVFLVNISKANILKQQNKWFKDIKEWVAKNSAGDPVIPYSATFEQEYAELKTPEEQKKFVEECKVPSMMGRIITSGYKALKLVNFFTTGEDEVRSWSIRVNTKAPQAAATIHTDFEKHFICAMVYNYDQFKETGSEKAAKEAGYYREQGKTYVVQDGDIMLIRENSKKK